VMSVFVAHEHVQNTGQILLLCAFRGSKKLTPIKKLFFRVHIAAHPTGSMLLGHAQGPLENDQSMA